MMLNEESGTAQMPVAAECSKQNACHAQYLPRQQVFNKLPYLLFSIGSVCLPVSIPSLNETDI
jgi:hypothetical protein